MPVQNPFPLEIIDKVNSPALQAWFQQFGEEGYLSADEINTIVTALNYLHENGGEPGAGGGSYIQRQISYITASRNLVNADKVKTIIVDNSATNPVLTILDNTYAISDEVEIYNRNNFNFKITNAGANTGIIYFGEFYDTGDDIILPAGSKTWLKCINSNLFELSSERKPLKTINNIDLYGVGNIPIVGGGSTLITTNRRTSSHTLALTDANKLVEMNVATANNLTVPPNASVAFPIGTPIDISQYGAGVTTIVAGAGVTIRSANNWYKINAQFAAASLLKIAENEWYLFGNLNA